MSLPAPRYSFWQTLSVALALGQRALEEVRALAREPGPEGKTGERGVDGLGFDNLTIEHDGEREFTFKLARGDQIKEFKFSVPLIIDRGVWKEGPFVKGDGVTWGGSFWIAQKDTDTKPDTPNSDWRLAIKRGRDGKDGKPGDKGEKGPDGKPGRDGRTF